MFRFKAVLINSLLLAILLFAAVPLVRATTRSFTVPAGEEVTEFLNLAIEDHVTIIFTLGGLSGNTIDFYITYPNGTVKEFGKVGNLDYRFVCDVKGDYILHFSNKDATQEKLVTLNYEIQHYIFGIPQTLFLTLIIAAVCVAAVATFVLMGKRR